MPTYILDAVDIFEPVLMLVRFFPEILGMFKHPLVTALAPGLQQKSHTLLVGTPEPLNGLLICKLVIFTMHCYASVVYCVSLVKQSVHLFITSPCSVKTAKRGITKMMPYDSSGTLVFPCQRAW